ncbi:beta-ketoacyl-[acyl-carrier-protein] synthase family protein [Fodinicola feengrottensis]|uniref:Beta-ketoacyl-[acyl-carrier-protein] synthase family protein n=1 Tax=Fodinicola feengrottensis TaxID=435914 RepID=A0ABN2I930_9ACTN|nr:beta-ketoacyl-[acyl-carrier-protein] synthase family protein [Fodinicola feengrottensis]
MSKAVVTGIGVVAPGGIGTRAFWDLLSSGRTATRAITHFDTTGFRSRIGAEVDFDPADSGLTHQETRRMDRAAQFAAVCTDEAIADSGLDFAGIDPGRIGVSIGSAVGCTVSLEREYVVLSDTGKNWLVDETYQVPHLYSYMAPSSLGCEVAWRVGAEGPVAVVSTGCTSGLDAVGHAVGLIEEGTADIVLAGATDAPISPITVACFDAIKATSPNNEDPEHALRPFDRRRNGFVLGEGAAIFVLESAEHARRRGVRGYVEIGGFATRSNAFHMTGLKPDGRELSEAIAVAMDRAHANPEDIDYVNAHGSGTKQNDRHETAAFKRALGERAHQVPVSSIKSMIGHSLGAIGSLEIAACALALQNQVVPPTANLEEPDPECDLDYVPKVARERELETILTVGSGFGGFQSAMVLSKPAGEIHV